MGLFIGDALDLGFLTGFCLGLGLEACFLAGFGFSLGLFIGDEFGFGFLTGLFPGLSLRLVRSLDRRFDSGNFSWSSIGTAPLDGMGKETLADDGVAAVGEHDDLDVVGGQFRRHARLVIEEFDAQRNGAASGADGHRVGSKPTGDFGLFFVRDDGKDAGGRAGNAIVGKVHREDRLGAVGRLIADAKIAEAGAAKGLLALRLDEDRLRAQIKRQFNH